MRRLAIGLLLALATAACYPEHQVAPESGANLDLVANVFTAEPLIRVTDPKYGNVCYVWSHGISCVPIAAAR